jgi:hypothetical protein
VHELSTQIWYLKCLKIGPFYAQFFLLALQSLPMNLSGEYIISYIASTLMSISDLLRPHLSPLDSDPFFFNQYFGFNFGTPEYCALGTPVVPNDHVVDMDIVTCGVSLDQIHNNSSNRSFSSADHGEFCSRRQDHSLFEPPNVSHNDDSASHSISTHSPSSELSDAIRQLRQALHRVQTVLTPSLEMSVHFESGCFNNGGESHPDDDSIMPQVPVALINGSEPCNSDKISDSGNLDINVETETGFFSITVSWRSTGG